MSWSLNMIYIWELLVFLFINSSICTVCAYSDFFLVWKLCRLLQTILDLWPVLILEIFSSWDIKNGQFQFLVTFLSVTFWSVDCTSGLYIITSFEHGQCFISGFLVFSLSVFSVFKYLKLTLSSNFSWSGNVEVLICKLYRPCL